MAVKFTSVTPTPIKVDDMLKIFRQVVKDEIAAAAKEFAKTYATWQHKPDFEQAFDENRNRIQGSTLTSGEGSKDNPYPFITKGTSVRYATMTPDFSPKTTKRVIGSKGGRGGVLYIDKRQPRPGIEAREYEDEIAKREQPKFNKRGKAAMRKAVKASGHSI